MPVNMTPTREASMHLYFYDKTILLVHRLYYIKQVLALV
uniref:Uncharacterized protein n=1 Tax=Rhizophora mucronata TaxID=61149 RepID=A0A2P2N5I0_RHIMU